MKATKKIVSVILAITLAVVAFVMPVSAAKVYPLVIVDGIFSTPLYKNVGTVDEAPIFATDDANYNFKLSANPTYLDAYKRGISSNAYLTQPGTNTGFGYYALGNNVPVAAGYTELSSFVKTLRGDINYVVYRVNGADVATAYGIPYTATVDLSAYQGRNVPVTVLAFSSTGAKVAEETFNIYVH